MRRFIALLGLLLLVPLPLAATIIIPQSVVASGCGDAVGSAYRISGTIGQPFIGPVTGATHRNEIGFWYGPAWLVSDIADTVAAVPAVYRLTQARPNPFRDRAVLSYELPEPCMVRISVYDVAGRLTRTLVDRMEVPGVHEVSFRGDGLPCGVFYIRMSAGRFTRTERLLLLK